MFVAILSSIQTGQVRRRSFSTWDKARAYADNWLTGQLRRRHATARDYCVEIQFIEAEASERPAAARKNKLAA